MLDGLHEEMVSAQKVVSESREVQDGMYLCAISVKLCNTLGKSTSGYMVECG